MCTIVTIAFPSFVPWSEIRHRIHGTKRTTLIRNISGSLPSFLTELTAVLQIPPPKKILYTHPPTGGLTGAATNGTGSYKSNASRHGGGEAGRGGWLVWGFSELVLVVCMEFD